MKLKKGDWVVVQNAPNYYDVTGNGSIGKIISTHGRSVGVIFTYITNDISRKNYTIQKEFLRKATKLHKLLYGIED